MELKLEEANSMMACVQNKEVVGGVIGHRTDEQLNCKVNWQIVVLIVCVRHGSADGM